MTDDSRDPETAFEELGHEIRFGIVETLGSDEPLSFGDLRDSLDVRDSGQFNYHLDRLRGTFVERATDEESYVLTAAGRRVYGAVLAESFTGRLDGEAVEMAATCEECGGQFETRFEGDHVVVACSDCEVVYTEPDVPPGLFDDWNHEDAPSVVARWTAARALSDAAGICPECSGRVDRYAALPHEAASPDWSVGDRFDAHVMANCRRCHRDRHSLFGIGIVFHPAVAAFHANHGVDVRTTPQWSLDWTGVGVADVVRTDPLRVAVPVSLADDRRVFVFDRELTLVGEYCA